MTHIVSLFIGIALLAGACSGDNNPADEPDAMTTTPVVESTIDPERFAAIEADAQPVEVLIATSDITEGTTWADAQQHIGVVEIPIGVRPSTFSAPDGPGFDDHMVAIGDIPKNQIIVAALFIPPTITGAPQPG